MRFAIRQNMPHCNLWGIHLTSPCTIYVAPALQPLLTHSHIRNTHVLSVCTSAVCRRVRPDHTGLRADHNPIPIHSGPPCPSFSRSYPPFMKLFHLVSVEGCEQRVLERRVLGRLLEVAVHLVSSSVGASFHRGQAR